MDPFLLAFPAAGQEKAPRKAAARIDDSREKYTKKPRRLQGRKSVAPH